ncbi:MAG: 16S rRNA (cytosine(967)-C(5))-methyltransferase RsmB [Melioribacteraceae bacterium]|nr:16S rRNA (cytosine(967)-C(5))-methyltransferase RsmB [Melioribacteraceae bacterium]MCF8263955.1 16S rRNA (cytosine(967)-C(5))-methyltransferase RsmB [Melioribacteraceae bacterium]MCF8431325.1 16S rRNA (cytosine(967)-C(5))-methyltransferase RsmB [Melioribacteraceae bacterium]
MNDVRDYTGLNLYQGVRGLSVKILNRIDRTDAYLDKMLDIEIKNSDLSGQDKALLFEIVHGVIRWLGRIDWILTGFYKGQFSKCIPNVKNAMRVALYQILFLDRVPDHAAVNEAVNFVKKLQGQKSADLTNAVLRNIIRNKDGIRYPKPDDDLAGYFSAYYSHPSWLVKRWLKRYDREFTENLLKANNQKPTLTLRVNTNKIDIEEFKTLLQKVDLKYSQGEFLPEFFKMHVLSNITDWEYFAKGYFTIQDESTGVPCKLLGANESTRVLDLCSAPGGKAAFLSNIMKNRGEIIALDKFAGRIKILESNMQRLAVDNVKIVEADALQFSDENGFDRILIDVPCSGLGTLTKKPDIKWKRDIGDFRKLASLQLDLLKKGASLLKNDGVLVYSTCTIEPDENYNVVQKFLTEHPEFELQNAAEFVPSNLVDENGCVQTFPNKHGLDGSFSARLKRK